MGHPVVFQNGVKGTLVGANINVELDPDNTTLEVSGGKAAVKSGVFALVANYAGTWRQGSGAPSNGTGINGDLYLRTSNGDVYQRAAGVYTVVGNLLGPAGVNGATWLTGTGIPGGGTGVNGDLYLRTPGCDVYKKTAGTWDVLVNIKGADGVSGSKWYSGEGNPASDLGVTDDLYINIDSGEILQKGDSDWITIVDTIFGTNGTNGATWINVVGVPDNGVGNNGDYCLDTATGDVYTKGDDTWNLLCNIRGTDGTNGNDGRTPYRGDWSSAVDPYLVGDIVNYVDTGDLYHCLINNTNNDPTGNPTEWKILKGTDGTDGTNGLSLTFRDAWISGTDYHVNDVLTTTDFSGKVQCYICTIEDLASTLAPTENFRYALIAQAGADGNGFLFRGDYNNGNSYVVNDVVRDTEDGYSLYICIVDVPTPGSGPPNSDTTNWALYLPHGATGAAGADGEDGEDGAAGTIAVGDLGYCHTQFATLDGGGQWDYTGTPAPSGGANSRGIIAAWVGSPGTGVLYQNDGVIESSAGVVDAGLAIVVHVGYYFSA